MEPIQVLIVRVTGSEYWYRDCIGETFTCYDQPSRDYVLAEDFDLGYNHIWRHILKEDAEVVK